MSALDFGGGSWANSFSRRYYFTGPALPDSDWSIGWVKRSTTAPPTDVYPTLFQTADGVQGTTGGLIVQEYGDGTDGSDSIQAQATGGSAMNLGAANDYDPDVDVWNVLQRRGSNLEWYRCVEGGTVSAATDSTAWSGTTIAADEWSFGWDWRDPLGEIFVLSGSSLTAAQVTELASGKQISALAGVTPLIHLAFRDGAGATEGNLGSGGSTYDATRDGTGFTTTTEFFALLGISAQPTEQVAADGATATFTATVVGETSLQWERLPPGGGSWANVSGGSGATTESYTTGTLSRGTDAGALYRLNVDGGALYSEPALLRVTAVPASYSGVGLVVGSSASHVGAAAVGATDSTITTYPVTLDATCSTSATRTVSAQLARGATSSLTAAIARHVGAIRNAAQALSADKTVQASLLRNATSSLSATALAARVALLTLDATSALSAAVTRSAALVQSATTTATASIARSVSAIRGATTTLSAAAQAAIARALGATTTTTASATPVLEARRTFVAEQVLTAAIFHRAVTRALDATQTIVPTLAKLVAAARSATTTQSAAVVRTAAQSVGATMTTSATVTRQAARTVGATQAQTATVGRLVAITRSATQTLSATALASRKFFVSLACAVSMTVDLALETIFGGHPFTPTRGARVQGASTAARVTSPTVTAGIPEAGAARVSGAASKARVR